MKKSSEWHFTFSNLKLELEAVQRQGFEFCKLEDQFALTSAKPAFLRVDVDTQPEKCRPVLGLLSELKISASFFFRMHSNNYNLLSTGCLEIIEQVRAEGHEIGLHSENIEVAGFLGVDPTQILQNDLDSWRIWFNSAPAGVSSHGGGSNLNNLHFWFERSPADFGLMYEAYGADGDNGPFSSLRYVSDSNWTEWKAYQDRKLLPDDHRSPGEHSVESGLRGLYILIHPETYSWRHPYELSY